jgi:hypothetical protein
MVPEVVDGIGELLGISEGLAKVRKGEELSVKPVPISAIIIDVDDSIKEAGAHQLSRVRRNPTANEGVEESSI